MVSLAEGLEGTVEAGGHGHAGLPDFDIACVTCITPGVRDGNVRRGCRMRHVDDLALDVRPGAAKQPHQTEL